MSDLSLVPIEDLIDEIAKRCNGLLIVTDRSEDSGEPIIMTDFRGGNARAVGLARIAMKLCENKILKTFEDEK